jgi:hypothetical protein
MREKRMTSQTVRRPPASSDGRQHDQADPVLHRIARTRWLSGANAFLSLLLCSGLPFLHAMLSGHPLLGLVKALVGLLPALLLIGSVEMTLLMPLAGVRRAASARALRRSMAALAPEPLLSWSSERDMPGELVLTESNLLLADISTRFTVRMFAPTDIVSVQIIEQLAGRPVRRPGAISIGLAVPVGGGLALPIGPRGMAPRRSQNRNAVALTYAVREADVVITTHLRCHDIAQARSLEMSIDRFAKGPA